MENSQPLINSSDDAADYLPHLSNSNGDGESEHNLSAEVVKGALETTALTGKFWNDWEELKSMLYFQLKQVLSEYPEATMSDDEQNSALGESYMQLVKRLEGALFSFIDGPPFTLQRLSEILLDARAIYPNLSKLALALEKNLLVTSTLTKSTDPYPPSTVQSKEQAEDTLPQLQSQIQTHTQPEPEPEPEPEPKPKPKPEPESESESKPEPEPDSGPLHELSPAPAAAQQEAETEQSDAHPNNGGESMAGDKDEVMTEVDTKDGDGCIGFDSFERVVNAPDTPDSPPLPTFNPDPFSSL